MLAVWSMLVVFAFFQNSAV